MGQKSKKILFLDRDGVINKKPKEHEYVLSVKEFIFNTGIFDVASYFKNRGYEIIVITNQRGISMGFMTVSDLESIHDYMKSKFEESGISILDIFYCPHGFHECECRKPKDGMLKLACGKYLVDIKESLLISDSSEDVEMGNSFGVSSYKVPHDKPETVMNFIL